MSTFATSPEQPHNLAQAFAYDDVVLALNGGSHSLPEGPAETGSTSPAALFAETAIDQSATYDSDPLDGIWISRSVLYAQGALIVLVGVIGLLLGLLIGGRHGDTPKITDASSPISVHFGTISKGANNTLSPDDEWIVIVLPTIPAPAASDRLTEKNFAPDRGPPSAEEMQLLAKMGGAFARPDGKGNATITLSKPGEYTVCFISRRGKRPAKTPPAPSDLTLLSRYFQQPQNLLLDRKYRLLTESLSNDQKLVPDFASPGK